MSRRILLIHKENIYVSNYTLKAQSALSGFSQDFSGIKLCEIVERAIVSMAIPKAGKETLNAQIKQAFGVSIPDVGGVALSTIDNTQILRLQDDLCFVLFDYNGDRSVQTLKQKVSDAYLTDQSDSWVMLRISGKKSRNALARTCPIDLHPSVFSPGSVTRTLMEHMGVVIICEAEGVYTLMALRSYAESFLHALRVSIENIM